jgi:hypothetical protein
VDFNCVQRCQGIVTAVAVECSPMGSSRIGRRLMSRPMSSSRGLRILVPMRALVSPSVGIFVSLPLCFEFEHFIIYVSLL